MNLNDFGNITIDIESGIKVPRSESVGWWDHQVPHQGDVYSFMINNNRYIIEIPFIDSADGLPLRVAVNKWYFNLYLAETPIRFYFEDSEDTLNDLYLTIQEHETKSYLNNL